MAANGRIDTFNSGIGFKVAHLNVRSLTGGHKFDMLKHQITTSNIDLFTLSETWLTPGIPDSLIELTTHSVARLDRSWSENSNRYPKKGGGLACFVRQGINFSDTKFADLNKSCSDLEMQWVAVSLDKVRPITIVNIYRPPQGDYKNACKLINEAFERADMKDNTDIFVLGDFNINYRDTNSRMFKELDFTMKSLGLTQLIHEPTRLSFRNGSDTSTILDLIFTNSEAIINPRLLDLNLSDHMGVMVTRKKVSIKPNKIEFKGRSYKNYVKEDFQERLTDMNWGAYYRLDDPNILWDHLKTSILEAINPMCPLQNFRVPEAKELWLTNEALEAIRDKDKLLGKARRTRSIANWEAARAARNGVGRQIENLRIDFLKEQQVLHKSDPKKFWNTISSVIPNKKKSSAIINLKDRDSDSEVEQERVANFMNSFFTSVGPNLAQKHTDRREYFGDIENQSIEDITTDTDEVILLCREIEILKSSGIDEISSKICKDAFLVLAEQLVHLFNSSLRTGIFPDEWKIAKVIPLYKGGDREMVGNYRPVSLLPLPGKLLEKIVHDRISKFFEETDFLSPNQGGFRKGFSTVSTIADLTDDLFSGINKGFTSLAAFIDLQKAFDTVNFEILLNKLNNAGVRNTAGQWCESYLMNRSQKTLINGQTSDVLPVKCGVPQGSVLGPLFFLVFINDLQRSLSNCKVKLYADDSVLYHSGINVQETVSLLQTSLDEFGHWCRVNRLTVNTKKSKLMVFGTRAKVKKAKNIQVFLNGIRLQKVPTFKYLGMVLDPTLNFNHHVSFVIRTVLHKMTLLAKVKKYLNNDVALQIYKSMILPYLDYADVIFAGSNSGDLAKLQRLQSRCLRICLGHDRFFSTDRAHKHANVPFLKDRRKAHTLNFMYIRQSRKELLNVREIRTRAHDAPLFNVPVPRCEAFKRSVIYLGSTEWNSLNPEIRNTNLYLPFKFLQKKEMLRPLEVIGP